jgi:hypothetical protein
MKPYRNLIRVRLIRASGNRKTGPIPVSISSRHTCDPSCPLLGHGCYATNGHLAFQWNRVDRGSQFTWDRFIADVRALPRRQLWRHNQAADLAGIGATIDAELMAELVHANMGRHGFTYTHKAMSPANQAAVKHANENGFTVNLSADNLREADELASLNVAPVVVILPKDQQGNTATPAGRKVVVCPYYTTGRQCANCALCDKADRSCIVGFPAHGSGRNMASAVAVG